MADALCWLLASHYQIQDVIHLESHGAAHSQVAPMPPSNQPASAGRSAPSTSHRNNGTSATLMREITLGTVKITGPAGVGYPRPAASSSCITPSAAARPNALPPESRIACACSTDIPGASNAVSRDPGAAPRVSPAMTLGSGRRHTVQPVTDPYDRRLVGP